MPLFRVNKCGCCRVPDARPAKHEAARPLPHNKQLQGNLQLTEQLSNLLAKAEQEQGQKVQQYADDLISKEYR
jgi:hypothetical protein